YGIKVWNLAGAVVNNRVIIRSLDAYHLKEFASLVCSQSSSLFLAQGFGVLVVLFCAYDHLARHGDICSCVLVVVHNKLKSGQEILCSTVRFLLTVLIYPFYALTQFERPGKSIALGTPIFCECRDQFTVGII